MEFYKLDSNFLKTDTIDEFISGIWTERYTKTGDFNLVLSPTERNRTLFPEGSMLQVNESDEVGLIDNALVEDGQLKLTGNMITEFLNERFIHTSPIHTDKQLTMDAPSPAAGLTRLVRDIVVDGGSYTSQQPMSGFDAQHQVIPNLSIISADPVYPPGTRHILSLPADFTQLSIPYGPLYDALAQIADTYQVGFKMCLGHADHTGYSLVFKTWVGKDRTSQQNVNRLVQFSPAMDTLTGLKELHSIANYKTVAYAWGTNDPNGLASSVGIAEAYPGARNEVGFARRNLMVEVSDIDDKVTDSTTFLSILNQRAKDALANNNYTKVVDGEVIPQTGNIFGVDYGLGDIIELKGISNVVQDARITEYIRSQDSNGERAYPTVSVI